MKPLTSLPRSRPVIRDFDESVRRRHQSNDLGHQPTVLALQCVGALCLCAQGLFNLLQLGHEVALGQGAVVLLESLRNPLVQQSGNKLGAQRFLIGPARIIKT